MYNEGRDGRLTDVAIFCDCLSCDWDAIGMFVCVRKCSNVGHKEAGKRADDGRQRNARGGGWSEPRCMSAGSFSVGLAHGQWSGRGVMVELRKLRRNPSQYSH